MIVSGALLWIVIGLSIRAHWMDPKAGHFVRLFVAYGAAFVVFHWLAGAGYRASAFGNMMLLGPN